MNMADIFGVFLGFLLGFVIVKLNDYKGQEVVCENHTNTVFNVFTNYVHIPSYNYRRKVCKLKTSIIEEKHQVLITDDIPPVIIHYHDCKFCKYGLNKKGSDTK